MGRGDEGLAVEDDDVLDPDEVEEDREALGGGRGAFGLALGLSLTSVMLS